MKALLAITLLGVLLLSSCGRNDPAADEDSAVYAFHIDDAYNYVEAMGTAGALISGFLSHDYRIYALIAEIGNIIPTNAPSQNISFTTGRDIGIQRVNQLTLNYNEIYDFGLLTFRLHHHGLVSLRMRGHPDRRGLSLFEYNVNPIETRLPFWLYSGIEAIARRNIGWDCFLPGYGVGELVNGFGDHRFLPTEMNFDWGHETRLNAIATAYYFVSYLINSGHFDYLLGLYAEGNRQEANALAEELFYGLTGLTLDTDVHLMFAGGYFVATYRGYLSYVNFIFASTSRARLAAEGIRGHARVFERATEIAKGWFLQYLEWDYRRINHNVVGLAGSSGSRTRTFSLNGTTSIYCLIDPWVAIHETVHSLEHQINGWSRFFPFTEGLAMYISDNSASDPFGRPSIYQDLTNPNRIRFSNSLFSPTGRNFVPELNNHNLAGGFVTHLIQTYGMEKYLRVHWRSPINSQFFKYVYGRSFEEILEEWVELVLEGRI